MRIVYRPRQPIVSAGVLSDRETRSHESTRLGRQDAEVSTSHPVWRLNCYRESITSRENTQIQIMRCPFYMFHLALL